VKKKWSLPSALAATVLAVAAFGFYRATLLYPLTLSENNLKLWGLKNEPLGSSPADVEAFMIRQGWKVNYHWQGIPTKMSETFYPGVKGSKIVGAYVGHYQGVPWRIDIDTYWGFDNQGRLIDLRFRKGADAL
jgi:hypothetical protein